MPAAFHEGSLVEPVQFHLRPSHCCRGTLPPLYPSRDKHLDLQDCVQSLEEEFPPEEDLSRGGQSGGETGEPEAPQPAAAAHQGVCGSFDSPPYIVDPRDCRGVHRRWGGRLQDPATGLHLWVDLLPDQSGFPSHHRDLLRQGPALSGAPGQEHHDRYANQGRHDSVSQGQQECPDDGSIGRCE